MRTALLLRALTAVVVCSVGCQRASPPPRPAIPTTPPPVAAPPPTPPPTRDAVAHVSFGPLEVHGIRGVLPSDALQPAVRLQLGALRSCYETALHEAPGLTGSVDVQFLVRADGSVGFARVTQTTFPSAAVGECAANVVHHATFPAPPGGAVIVVDCPVQFDLD